ncbi:MAG: TetR/AcrR family transcriptional regulator [Pseudomonadota bacterium]
MDTREQILASAQRLVQQRGFNGFSYADIAAEVGIRKASLHHHFPTKNDLGLALIEVYSAQFDSELQRIQTMNAAPLAKLSAYIAAYRTSLENDRMCLCGMLASEIMTLDASMWPSLKQFFTLNTEWLTDLLHEGKSQQLLAFDGAAADHARLMQSTLQGASLICRASGDLEGFDRTAALCLAGFLRKN